MSCGCPTGCSGRRTSRSLLENWKAIDPEWRADARVLMDFAKGMFISVCFDIAGCGEHDHQPWGGILSTWGAVMALCWAATPTEEFVLRA